MAGDKESVGRLLDGLYLEMLDLVEQQARAKVNIEKLSNGGQLLLAKTRYIQGSQTIGVAQIPAENSGAFLALTRVEQEEDDGRLCGEKLVLKREVPNKESGQIDPMRWFSVLAPNSLRAAADQFKKCLTIVIENANIQRELTAVLNHMETVKQVWMKEYSK